ncbi:hypothetical protein J3R83DRAFT_2896 [Lanmaoa asiatica]|nr:hypothetical protein J3R83DRAFT_2896 [Lanmaoa asiatica]
MATSIEVKWLFSCGCLVLSHVQSSLSAQLTHALLYLSYWSQLGFIEAEDLKNVTKLPEVTAKDAMSEDDCDI